MNPLLYTLQIQFLGVVAKLRQIATSFVIFVYLHACPSVRPLGTTRLALDGFS